MRLQVLVVACLIATGCAGNEQADLDLSGATVTIDSTADTVRVTVSGDPAPERVRHTVEERRIGTTPDDTSLFGEVYEFEVDRLEQIWAYDQPARRIFLFDKDGQLIRTVGRAGAGPGEFQGNGGMTALADGGIALWDFSNARISIFAESGDFVRSIVIPAGFSTSDGMHSDRHGALYIKRPVTPPRPGEILGRMGLVRLDSSGAFLDSLAPPDLDAPREMYVASRGGGTSSTSSRYTGGYRWAWSPAGYFAAANGATYQMVIAPLDGKPVTIQREMTATPLTDEQRSEEQEYITAMLRMTDPSWTWNGPAIPRTAPLVDALLATRDGRIWARVPVAVERIPDDEIVQPRNRSLPSRHFRMVYAWEVFEPSGRFLGRVDLPPRTTLIQADGNQLWVIERDENDLPAIVRLRVDPAF